MDLTAVILAGGESLRMGREKAFIDFNGEPLVKRTVGILKPLFEKILIVSKEREPFLFLGVPVYVDLYPNGGPMGGIYTGLFHSKGPVFAVACDMPFLDPGLIRYMAGQLQGFDAVVPGCRDGVHPLHALYSKTALPEMKRLLENGDVKMTRLLEKINTRTVGEDEIRKLNPDLSSLVNINTPGDLKKALEMTSK